MRRPPIEVVYGTSVALVGAGVVTAALFPFALPLLILTAVAAIPLALPALVLGLLAGVVALSILLLRTLARWIGRGLGRRGRTAIGRRRIRTAAILRH
jgi:hypothetical protein